MTESHECLLAFCPRWTAYAVQYFAPGLKTCDKKKSGCQIPTDPYVLEGTPPS